MTSNLLVSRKIADEFTPRLTDILRAAPRPIEILPFTKDLAVSDAAAGDVEAAYYSRDVWEGTVKDELTPAARAFWTILDRAPNLKWLAVYSPFWRLPNVLISPHNAGASTGTYGRGVEIFLRNLESYLSARPMQNEAAPD